MTDGVYKRALIRLDRTTHTWHADIGGAPWRWEWDGLSPLPRYENPQHTRKVKT